MLDIRRLERLFLRDISFELHPGECVVLLGESGSGKSTLLRAVADLDPNQADIALEGASRDQMDGPGWRKSVAYLPSDSGWWEERVAEHFESVAFVREHGPRLGLSRECADWSVARLSSGERQRLALLRLFEGSPKILLLDEPTSNLDPDSTTLAEQMITNYLGEGHAALVVTHDREQAIRIGSRALRLEDGRLVPVSKQELRGSETAR